MKETLSVKLLNTLNRGKKQVGKEALCHIVRFVESQKTDEEAFVNKNNATDLYYTMFGWLLACVLDIRLDSKKTILFLEQQNIANMDLIHYAAFVRCKVLQKLLAGNKIKLLLDRLTSTTPIKSLHEFKGFPHNDAESPYSQFIWLSLKEDINQNIAHKEEIKANLLKYKVPEGGYSNIAESKQAATNATVAALAIYGQLDGYKENEDTRFLQQQQQDSGGFAAVTNSPVPDLLSTATALFMLRCYNMTPKVSPRDFIEAHWLDSGGFSATLLEETSDVEYTFYGLLALGSLPD